MLYVKNKMAEAYFCPKEKFLAIVGCFLISGPRYIEYNKPKEELDPEDVPEGQ